MQAAIDTLIRHFGDFRPACALVLGSGLGAFAEKHIQDARELAYSEIPGFGVSTAIGHKGKLVCGYVDGLPVACMQGRLHLYEGYDYGTVTTPLRVLNAWGAGHLFISNASGGIREAFQPGDVMLIEDHINYTGGNPLVGRQACSGSDFEDAASRFPDMTRAYDREYLEKAKNKAQAHSELTVHRGIYIGVLGPTFETPAEIRMFQTFGADAVGMSTVAEVIVARQLGMRVLGLSLITNKAAGLSGGLLSAEEVFENARRVQNPLEAYMRDLLGIIAEK